MLLVCDWAESSVAKTSVYVYRRFAQSTSAQSYARRHKVDPSGTSAGVAFGARLLHLIEQSLSEPVLSIQPYQKQSINL